MKINWKSKLASRKFWAAVAAWITSVLTAFGVTDNIIARVSLIVAGIGALAIYMLAEALTDKARTNGTQTSFGVWNAQVGEQPSEE
ncbi:MAG: hypothetical protein FWF10_00675 [Clostridiales bacterium]|nr:hypothetical protein [Clostridiales bacterium]